MKTNDENENRRVLVVDDDPAALKIVELALRLEGYQVRTAASGEEALGAIDEWQPHLVLLDVNMPGLNGHDVLLRVREKEEYISTMFVSGQDNSNDIILGLDSGADDYICKPYNPTVLLSRVRCQLRINDIREELRRANNRLEELVNVDDLTGLFNMRSLYQRLDQELHRAARYERSVCAIMMDMDHFKEVNDQNDHLFGSFVLKEVGQIIKGKMRKVDFAARYGGDEFLIVLTEIDVQGALKFCERLRAAIAKYQFKNNGCEKRLTASIGFAVSPPGSMTVDARSLVRRADRALYRAKDAGRNTIEFDDFSETANSLQEEKAWKDSEPNRRGQA